MDYQLAKHENDLHITMSGQFTFSDNAKFRTILEQLNDRQIRKIIIQFSEVDFIDSAGLGMLLLLRDECQERNILLTLMSAKGQVEKIFMISKFDQLFTMAS